MGRSVGPWGDVYAKPRAVPKPKGELRVVRERPQGAPRNKTIMALAGEVQKAGSGRRPHRSHSPQAIKRRRREALRYVDALERGHKKKDRLISELHARLRALESQEE